VSRTSVFSTHVCFLVLNKGDFKFFTFFFKPPCFVSATLPSRGKNPRGLSRSLLSQVSRIFSFVRQEVNPISVVLCVTQAGTFLSDLKLLSPQPDLCFPCQPLLLARVSLASAGSTRPLLPLDGTELRTSFCCMALFFFPSLPKTSKLLFISSARARVFTLRGAT